MLPPPKQRKAPLRHQRKEYRHAEERKKDLKAFFSPLSLIILCLCLVAYTASRTTGRHGIMPEYETDAGDPKYSLLHSEDTYYKIASSMGGFPVKHFFKNGASIVPHSDGQPLRRIEDGVGGSAGVVRGVGGGTVRGAFRHSIISGKIPLVGVGLKTADLGQTLPHNWLSRRVSKMKQYFNIGGEAQGDGGGDSKRGLSHIVAVPVNQVYVLPSGEGGVTLSQGAKHTENTQQALDQKEKMKALIMHKILKLQQAVEADAKPRRSAMPAITVTHSRPVER